jgi:hypothetical protein
MPLQPLLKVLQLLLLLLLLLLLQLHQLLLLLQLLLLVLLQLLLWHVRGSHTVLQQVCLPAILTLKPVLQGTSDTSVLKGRA